MSAMSDYLELQIIDHLFRTGTFPKPAGIFFALFTANPTDANGGTEVSGGAYARVAVAQANAQWNTPVANNGHTDNVNAITFPAPTANWGSVTHIGIFDAAAAGNLLIHGALGTPKTVNSGDPAPSFGAGSMDITLA